MKFMIKVSTLLTVYFLSFGVYAQEREMTKSQVDQYMNSYDRAFDSNRSLMQDNVEEGLLRGELKLSEATSCRSLRIQKRSQLSSLKQQAPDYYQKLGTLDGKWDGRLEGCQEGFELMANRVDQYHKKMKHQWIEGISIGEKIAAIELKLFSSSPLNLENKCLDARRVQGVTRLFLSDDVGPGQQISEVQLDCQSQAKVVAQRFIQHKNKLMAQTQHSGQRQVERRAASVSED